MIANPVVSLLQAAYAAELETAQNYLANSAWIDGLRAQEVVEALTEDVADSLGHAQMLAQRLKQLGVRPSGSLALAPHQEFLQPPAESTDLRHVVTGALRAERAAIAIYREIVTACGDDDPATAELVAEVLAEEENHCSLFEGFLQDLDGVPVS